MEAQREAIQRFLRPGDVVIEPEYVEIETGKNDARPQLAAAMAACKKHRAKLLIAELDRLARDVAFIATLMKSDVKFTACDMPEADPFRLHIEAAIAEEEARKISARTKAALAAAKARGVKLGGVRLCADGSTNVARSAANRAPKPVEHYAPILLAIKDIQAQGPMSLAQIAGALNARGVKAPRGGEWQAMGVQRVLKRAV